MSQPAPEFVVHVDRAALTRRRSRARRATRVGLWVTVAGAAVIIGIGLTISVVMLGAGRATDGDAFLGFVIGLPGLILLASAAPQASRLRRLAPWYRGEQVPDEIMRIAPQGPGLGIEGASRPLWLPWPAVDGFEVRRSSGPPTLVLSVADGVGVGTPGVRGLDQPEVERALRARRGAFYGVDVLDQPLGAIDQALRRHSGGRVGITR